MIISAHVLHVPSYCINIPRYDSVVSCRPIQSHSSLVQENVCLTSELCNSHTQIRVLQLEARTHAEEASKMHADTAELQERCLALVRLDAMLCDSYHLTTCPLDHFNCPLPLTELFLC
jgi:hypothetical protein